jgi:hypothetical protein
LATAEAPPSRFGSNFRFVEIDGFDELFVDLNRELTGLQRFTSPNMETAPRQFDDEPVMSATWADVDTDLARTTLEKAAAAEGSEEVDWAVISTPRC